MSEENVIEGAGNEGQQSSAGGGDDPWYNVLGLDDENAEFVTKAGYKDANSAFQSMRLAEKKLGIPADRVLKMPDARFDQDPEAFADILKHLGVPDDPGGYELKGVEGVFDFADDGERKEVAEKLHKIGMPPAMAQKAIEDVYAPMVQKIQAGLKSEGEAAAAAAEKATEELKGEWGAAFEEKLEAAQAFLDEQDEGLHEFLNESGLNNDPRFVRFLDKMASEFAESSEVPGRRDGGGGGRQTPAEAEASLSEFEEKWRDALEDRSHPKHGWAVEQRTGLIKKMVPKG